MQLELYFLAESIFTFDIDLDQRTVRLVDKTDDDIVANIIVPENKRHYDGLEAVLQYHMDTSLPMEDLLDIIDQGLFYAGCQHNLKARINKPPS